jgi:uncharacterized protein (TIGR01244 family)
MAGVGRQLEDGLAVSPQIAPEEVAAVAAAGFRMIVNNRPDGEEPGQPSGAEIEAAAAAAGLAYRHIPVTSATLGPEAVEAFARARGEADGKVFAFCRSGTRCTVLWALSSAKEGARSPDELIETALGQGYDISNLRPALQRLAEGEG